MPLLREDQQWNTAPAKSAFLNEQRKAIHFLGPCNNFHFMRTNPLKFLAFLQFRNPEDVFVCLSPRRRLGPSGRVPGIVMADRPIDHGGRSSHYDFSGEQPRPSQ